MDNINTTYISFYGNKYNIQKRINNKSVLFARFDKLEDAIKYRDYCVKNNWNIKKCKLTKTTKKGDKHITKLLNGSYQVTKVINRKKIHYGIFNNIEEARKHRDYCIKNDWDKSCIKRKRAEYNKYNLPKYISYCKQSNRYVIAKQFKEGNVMITNFKTLEDAIKERDLLIKCNWDEDKLIELDETYGSLSY